MLTAPLLLALLAAPALSVDGDVLGQAKDHVRHGRLQDASLILSEALDAGAGDTEALRVALAEVRTQMDRSGEAIDTLAGLSSDNPAVAVALGHAYLKQADKLAADGASQEAIDEALFIARDNLESAVANSSNGGAPVWELGQVLLYRFGELDAALDLCEQALTANANDGEALLLRGAAGAYVYWNASSAGDTGGANEAWNAAVTDLERANSLLASDRVEPLGQLVWFYQAQDISNKAVDAARQIIARQPNPDFGVLFGLAVTYRDQGKLEPSGKALEAIVSTSARGLTDLIRASDDPTGVASRLAGSIHPYYQRGDKATCRSILAAIVAAEPTDADVWDNYAVICQETSRYDDAVMAYEKELLLTPENPRVYNDLGAIYQHFLRRDNDKAKELYEKCIALADEQLAMIDLPPAAKEHAAEAKRIAQDNMRSLTPAGGGKGLLDSMVNGLRGLNLPKPAEGAAAGGEGSDGGTEGDGSTEG